MVTHLVFDDELLSLQKCSDYMASSIPTFARTEPPDTQVRHIKKVLSGDASSFVYHRKSRRRAFILFGSSRCLTIIASLLNVHRAHEYVEKNDLIGI